MIRVSESAQQKLKELRQQEGKDESWFLRVKVKKGGCSGLSYALEFDQHKNPQDFVVENSEPQVIVDRDSFMYIAGMTLDYSGGLNGKGFVFENPNASKTCGCGSSFNV
ncbi:MAG: iron-sulfur cluster assembly accessory protein [Bdellovibrionaceae bacterium]|jgi:iron-sulfur cluster assembly protein|nr:iron-sulfur cluster assembly accessory protein [Pseudobdellovibrionaceae bacterium]